MNVARLLRHLTFLVTLVLAASVAGEAIAQSTNPRLQTRHTKYRVKIDSAPQKAAIYLDDKKYGIAGYTPWSGRLPKGTWKVILELEGYEPAERTIVVRRTRSWQETFVPLVKKVVPAKLDVRPDADKNAFGAKVWVDGQVQGQIPALITLDGGRHLVEVKKDGFETFEQWVEVKEGEKVTVNPMLRPVKVEEKGDILVEADVPGAQVYVDGNLHPDKTPTIITGVLVGPHVVEVRKEPALPWKQTVQVEAQKTVKVSAELKATIGGPGGSIRVLSSVDKATVYLDGTELGPAPIDVKDVKPGPHVIEVKAKGYLTGEKRVTVSAGSADVLKFELQPEAASSKNGTLKVVSPVPEAIVYVDGENVGQVPQTREIPAGDHFVVVEKKGYKKFEKKVRVEIGQTLAVTAVLKAVGGLRILSTPSGAEVLLDGAPIGATPMAKEDIDVGEHVITVRYADYYEAEKTVTVKGGELDVLSMKLEKIDTGPTAAELAREQRGLTSFGARPLPKGRTTFDMAMGYPYIFDVRFNVGGGKIGSKPFDAGATFRSFLSRSEISVTGRLSLADADPFSAGIFTTLGGGGNFFDDSARNTFFTDLGVMASLTGLGSVTLTGRAYLNLWSDRHCPEYDESAGDWAGDPMAVCVQWHDGNLQSTDPDKYDRIVTLVGEDGPLGRETGARAMVSFIVEIAWRQRWNLWALFEGAPFQSERAAYTHYFSPVLLEEDIGTYFRLGTTYKF